MQHARKTPLGLQPAKVMTHPMDLVTVCGNCHRMLHRMDGKPDDIAKLKVIIRKNRKGRG